MQMAESLPQAIQLRFDMSVGKRTRKTSPEKSTWRKYGATERRSCSDLVDYPYVWCSILASY